MWNTTEYTSQNIKTLVTEWNMANRLFSFLRKGKRCVDVVVKSEWILDRVLKVVSLRNLITKMLAIVYFSMLSGLLMTAILT